MFLLIAGWSWTRLLIKVPFSLNNSMKYTSPTIKTQPLKGHLPSGYKAVKLIGLLVDSEHPKEPDLQLYMVAHVSWGSPPAWADPPRQRPKSTGCSLWLSIWPTLVYQLVGSG